MKPMKATQATTFRFVVLAVAMTLCILAQRPRLASAAACPPSTCQTLASDCSAGLGCSILGLVPEGTCTEGGGTHNAFLFRCSCFTTACYMN